MSNENKNNGMQCIVCKKNIEDGLFKTVPIVPRSKGGRNCPRNQMIYCIDCSLLLRSTTLSTKVPVSLVSKLTVWKEEHMPTSSMSEVLGYCIKRTLSEENSDIVKLNEDILIKNRVLNEIVTKHNRREQLVDNVIELVKLYEE